MFIEPDEIGEAGLSFEHELTLDLHGEDGRPLLDGPARLRGQARRGQSGIELRGELVVTTRLECSRCLEPYETPLATTFELTVVGDAVEFGVREARVAAEDTSMFYADGGRADLRLVAAEQIMLNLPLKPVCREGCRGLCPTCGTNRNRIECDCRRQAPDLRLAPLEELRERLGGPSRKNREPRTDDTSREK